MAAIAVTRSDLTAIELRAAAGREKDSAASRRMLALAMVFDGADRTSAAETCGMDRQTLRDWVHRYNATGLAGLRNRKSSGRPPKLMAAQKAVLVELVEKGPDPARHKVVRWRAGSGPFSTSSTRRGQTPLATRSCAGAAATL